MEYNDRETNKRFGKKESGETPGRPRHCDRDETASCHCLRAGRRGSRRNESQETCRSEGRGLCAGTKADPKSLKRRFVVWRSWRRLLFLLDD